jgi:hypothetical protein
MNTTLIIILIVAAIVVVALVVAAVVSSRRRALRQRFGPEYDRVVAERNDRSAAERELRERERRHAELDLKPLSPEARSSYAEQWAQVQAQFVDAPEDAVRAGDQLVTRLIGEIGYPTENYEDQIATLSVEHARTLSHYRDAHDVFLRTERGEASTEQLRQALVHYRALFAELLGDQPVPPVDPAGSPASSPAEAPAEAATRTEPAADTEATADTEADTRTADQPATKQPHYR